VGSVERLDMGSLVMCLVCGRCSIPFFFFVNPPFVSFLFLKRMASTRLFFVVLKNVTSNSPAQG